MSRKCQIGKAAVGKHVICKTNTNRMDAGSITCYISPLQYLTTSYCLDVPVF